MSDFIFFIKSFRFVTRFELLERYLSCGIKFTFLLHIARILGNKSEFYMCYYIFTCEKRHTSYHLRLQRVLHVKNITNYSPQYNHLANRSKVFKWLPRSAVFKRVSAHSKFSSFSYLLLDWKPDLFLCFYYTRSFQLISLEFFPVLSLWHRET